MSDTRLSYLAGHFDGEGTLFMIASGGCLRPLPRVAVSGVYVPTLHLYQKQFGGQVVSVKVYPDRTRNPRPLFRWTLNRADGCRDFSDAMMPLCYEKREQLAVLRDYMAEHQRYGKTRSIVLRELALNVQQQLIDLKTGNFELKDKHEFSGDFAYLAGHFDGEGSVIMQDRKHGTVCPNLRISISAAYVPILRTYQQLFGGCVGYKKSTSANKTMFCWQLTHRAKCFSLLTSLVPFLQEKKEQAEVAINFLSKSLDSHVVGSNQFTRDSSILELAQVTMLRLRQLREQRPISSPQCSSG